MLTTYVHHILFIFSTKNLSKTWTMKLIVVALTFDFTHNRPDSAQKLCKCGKHHNQFPKMRIFFGKIAG